MITCLDLDATYVTEQIQQHFADFADRLVPVSSKHPQVHDIYKDADLIVIAVWSRFMKPVMQELVWIMKSWSW
jgi:glycerol-3-phosphate dehydrogenase